MIIGSTDEYDVQPKENIFEQLTEFLDNKPIWLTEKIITRKWYGIRSRPEGEASPILKNLDDGLILCTGFYKNGFLLAPLSSHWVADELKKYAKTENLAVVVKAEHHCMTHRGVREHESDMTTAIMLGAFKEDPATRDEFYKICMSMKGHG